MTGSVFSTIALERRFFISYIKGTASHSDTETLLGGPYDGIHCPISVIENVQLF